MWNSTLSKKVGPIINPDPESIPLAWRSPVEAESHADLPPAYIEVAEFDCLHDDGVLYAKLHPEKLHCYLSVCQCVHILSGTVYAAHQTAKLARSKGDLAAAARIEQQLDAFVHSDTTFSKRAFLAYIKLRDVTCAYQKSKSCKPMAAYIGTGLLSPDCDLRDLRWKLRQIFLSHAYFAHEYPLIEYLSMEFDLRRLPPQFRVPVFFLTSDDDRICPADLIEGYFRRISAPQKRLLRLQTQTHTLFYDEPDVFCQSIKDLLCDVR
jgi:pimeloyl-ACP methyl ester carboxylesterase